MEEAVKVGVGPAREARKEERPERRFMVVVKLAGGSQGGRTGGQEGLE